MNYWSTTLLPLNLVAHVHLRAKDGLENSHWIFLFFILSKFIVFINKGIKKECL